MSLKHNIVKILQFKAGRQLLKYAIVACWKSPKVISFKYAGKSQNHVIKVCRKKPKIMSLKNLRNARKTSCKLQRNQEIMSQQAKKASLNVKKVCHKLSRICRLLQISYRCLGFCRGFTLHYMYSERTIYS